jgi:hypothetical protein
MPILILEPVHGLVKKNHGIANLDVRIQELLPLTLGKAPYLR